MMQTRSIRQCKQLEASKSTQVTFIEIKTNLRTNSYMNGVPKFLKSVAIIAALHYALVLILKLSLFTSTFNKACNWYWKRYNWNSAYA